MKLVWRTLVCHNPVAVLLSLLTLLHIGQRLWRGAAAPASSLGTPVRRKFNHVDGIVIVLLLFGMSPLVVFAEATWVHPMFLLYLAPFFAVAGALGVNSIVQAEFRSPYYKGLIVAVLSIAFVLSSLLCIVVQSQYNAHEVVVWEELKQIGRCRRIDSRAEQ